MTDAGNKTDRINKMNRIMTNQSLGKTHPINPVHPVNGFALNEIIGKFGGADQLRNAVNRLQSLLYAI
jgi:hypothetical protein